MINFSSRVSVPDEVLVSEIDGESVLLNLDTGSYFGLDEVGSSMWNRVTGAGSVQAGYEALALEYDVDPDRLRADLAALLDELLAEGLLRLGP